MSEYQYYEFRAVDRSLDETARKELRALSSRARITAKGFVNHYEWGDFKGDPDRLTARYFDLFLYLANWGTRRLSIRLPARAFEETAAMRFGLDGSVAQVRPAGENAVIDIWRDDIDSGDWVEGEGWLDALAQLRVDLLEGDYRALYLVWLMSVEDERVEAKATEPLPGIGPLTPALEAFAEFFAIDPDLLAVAAENGATAGYSPISVRAYIEALADEEKTELLVRLHEGDPHLGAEFRRRCRAAAAVPGAHAVRLRTAGALRREAERAAEERRHRAEKRAAAERKRREAEAAASRRRHLDALARRGEAVWQEVEALIAQRNPSGYDRAIALLRDLRDILSPQGQEAAFHRRVADIRARHAKKIRFVERLGETGIQTGSSP